MIRSKKRVRLCALWLVLNLAFIWGNSLMPAEVSQAFSDWVKELLTGLFSGGGSTAGGSGLLRKIAHFTEFAALGMCLCWLTGMLGRSRIWALAAGCLAGCVDETIQVFVPDRGPGILDVCIDTAGAAAGILLLLFGHACMQKVNMKTQFGGIKV